MKHIILIFLFSISSVCYSQNNKEAAKALEYIISTQRQWKFFKLRDSINAEVIIHFKCIRDKINSISQCASATIVKTQTGDSIRILDLANYNYYQSGQKIKIIPAKKPSVKTHYPFLFSNDTLTGELSSSSNFDKTILRTTWGKIE
jgi:hypothetical protein